MQRTEPVSLANVPGAQTEHLERPEVFENVPAGHSSLAVLPETRTNAPGDAGSHEVRPESGWNSPTEHLVHFSARLAGENVPAGHGCCVLEPANCTKEPADAWMQSVARADGWYVPGWHASHTLSSVRYWPGAQGEHDTAPVELDVVPDGHFLQAVRPDSGWNSPMGHLVHSPARLAGENVPAGQGCGAGAPLWLT